MKCCVTSAWDNKLKICMGHLFWDWASPFSFCSLIQNMWYILSINLSGWPWHTVYECGFSCIGLYWFSILLSYHSVWAGNSYPMNVFILLCQYHGCWWPDDKENLPWNGRLTHRSGDKMAAIFQTILSNAFSWMRTLEFQLEFHWSLFLRFQLIINQCWFR